MNSDSVGSEGYSLLKDLRLEIEAKDATFSLCFWLYFTSFSTFPVTIIQQVKHFSFSAFHIVAFFPFSGFCVLVGYSGFSESSWSTVFIIYRGLQHSVFCVLYNWVLSFDKLVSSEVGSTFSLHIRFVLVLILDGLLNVWFSWLTLVV